MGPVCFILLVNRGNLTRHQLYRDGSDRIQNEPGCDVAYYVPSRVRPQRVVAEFEPELLFGQQYAAGTCRLEIEFWFPDGVDHERYRIEWVEPERNLGVGWHQDGTYSSLGPCHIQLDYRGRTVERERAEFLDRHPLNVLDVRLDQLRSLVPNLDWEGETPSLPSSGLAGGP